MNCVFCTDWVKPWSGQGCSFCSPGVGYLCERCGPFLANEVVAAEGTRSGIKRARVGNGSGFFQIACIKTTPPHDFSPALDQIMRDSSGWLIHKSEEPVDCRIAHLDRFLDACPPSSAPREIISNSGVAFSWIAVKTPSDSRDEMDEARMTAMMIEGGTLLGSLSEGQRPTSEQILNVARRHRYTSGKWLFFAGIGTMDRAWRALAKLVCLEAPASLTNTAKIATGADGRPSRVICVYLNDFDDSNAVEELGNLVVAALKEITPKGTISFKPDIYTEFGINTRNQWKIKPTLHIKRWGP